jgi:HD superfamily phosphohydrolase
VSEGVVGYERILKMLTVHNNELVVEEKGINSVEKFLVSRRLMYWQVYRHKTVVASENMLVKIVERAQYLFQHQNKEVATGGVLDYFLGKFDGQLASIDLNAFCQLDDTDILFAIKQWQHHSDKVLSTLCGRFLNRQIFKCFMQSDAIEASVFAEHFNAVKTQHHLSDEEAAYLCFTSETSNTMYHSKEETIKILLKSGDIANISAIQNALINESLSAPVKKFYICWLNDSSPKNS